MNLKKLLENTETARFVDSTIKRMADEDMGTVEDHTINGVELRFEVTEENTLEIRFRSVRTNDDI